MTNQIDAIITQIRNLRTPVAIDTTAQWLLGPVTGQVTLNVQQATGAGVDCAKFYANGAYRFRIDSNGAALFNAAFQFRSDAITGTTTPGTAISGTARVILRCATAANTANRHVQLPAANTMTAGQAILVQDTTGEAATKNITVNRAGSDTINGATSKAITTAYGSALFTSDGVSAWHAMSLPGL